VHFILYYDENAQEFEEKGKYLKPILILSVNTGVV